MDQELVQVQQNQALQLLSDNLRNILQVTEDGLDLRSDLIEFSGFRDVSFLKLACSMMRDSIFIPMIKQNQLNPILLYILPHPRMLHAFSRESAIDFAAVLMHQMHQDPSVVVPNIYHCCLICGLNDHEAMDKAWIKYQTLNNTDEELPDLVYVSITLLSSAAV